MKSYFKNIYQAVSSILIGMSITFRHLFYKSVTIQYPEQRLQLPERERNRLFVNIDDCIGCEQCSRACPVSCIAIETVKVTPGDVVGKTGTTSNGKKKALFVSQFDIDLAKCCFCQLCVFPCPTECIYMTDVFEYSKFYREDLIYRFSDLSPEQVIEKKNKAQEFALEQEKKKAEAAKAAAAAKPPDASAKNESNENKEPKNK
jgi:NADH-quinone oxidoreductase subunit I